MTIRRGIAAEPMSAADFAAAEALLARLAARAYAADNPHLFPRQEQTTQETNSAGPPTAAAAVGAAPAPNAGGPADWSMERDDGNISSKVR